MKLSLLSLGLFFNFTLIYAQENYNNDYSYITENTYTNIPNSHHFASMAIDVLSRIVLPTTTASYGDEFGGTQAQVNIETLNPDVINKASIDEYFDAIFTPRNVTLSVISCTKNRVDLALDNGFLIVFHNSNNPTRPSVYCEKDGSSFDSCANGDLPLYLTYGIVGGKNGKGKPNKNFLALIRSTTTKVLSVLPGLYPFTQVDTASMDRIISDVNISNSEVPFLVNQMQLTTPLGIQFSNDESETLLNIVYQIRLIIMQLACL